MTTRVEFTDNALGDLASIAEYIARDNPTRAHSFVVELRSRLEAQLSTFPHSGPALGNFRYMVVGRYLAVYRVNTDVHTVTVILVTEGHRDWRRLLKGLD